MKKVLMTLMMVGAALTAHAYDYPYLVFQTTDGTTTTLAVETLTIAVDDGQLVVTNSDGSTSFTLTDLSVMYFSAGAPTSVKTIDNFLTDADVEIYDLQGRKIPDGQACHGVYIVKSKNGTRKVNLK